MAPFFFMPVLCNCIIAPYLHDYLITLSYNFILIRQSLLVSCFIHDGHCSLTRLLFDSFLHNSVSCLACCTMFKLYPEHKIFNFLMDFPMILITVISERYLGIVHVFSELYCQVKKYCSACLTNGRNANVEVVQ